MISRHHQLGAQDVVRPPRDTSWWRRWKQERACRRAFGHCWHPEGFIEWFCCMCSGEVDGMPDQRCAFCACRLPATGQGY